MPSPEWMTALAATHWREAPAPVNSRCSHRRTYPYPSFWSPLWCWCYSRWASEAPSSRTGHHCPLPQNYCTCWPLSGKESSAQKTRCPGTPKPGCLISTRIDPSSGYLSYYSSRWCPIWWYSTQVRRVGSWAETPCRCMTHMASSYLLHYCPPSWAPAHGVGCRTPYTRSILSAMEWVRHCRVALPCGCMCSPPAWCCTFLYGTCAHSILTIPCPPCSWHWNTWCHCCGWPSC